MVSLLKEESYRELMKTIHNIGNNMGKPFPKGRDSKGFPFLKGKTVGKL